MRFPCALIAAAILASALPVAAHAGTCEDSFQRTGNAISGLRFIATTTVADLPPDVAINQMRGIAARRGYDIMASEPQAGALLIEQPMSGNSRAFPIEINAVQTEGMGTVRLEAKLRPAVTVGIQVARTEYCGMLAELRGGAEGRRLAASAAGAATVQTAPVTILAQEFAQQISKDAERNLLAVPARYAGKRFTLTGQVDYVTKDGELNRVAFKIMQPHQMAIRLPGMAQTISEVSCLMAPGTSVFVMQLRPGQNLRLTGTFHEYSSTRHVTWFKECAPVQGR